MLELQQTHRLYGRLTVSIAHNAVSVVSRDKDFRWVSKAPTWDVVAFNKVRKVFYKYPYQSWRKNGIRTALSVENNDLYLHWPLIWDGKQKYAELDAIVYDMPNEGRSDLTTGESIGKYIVLERRGIEPDAIRSIHALYDLPQVRGIPLMFTRVYGGHGWGFGLDYNKKKNTSLTWISTSSSKIRKLDQSLFIIPTGYKLGSDSEVLMRSSEVDDTFGQILN